MGKLASDAADGEKAVGPVVVVDPSHSSASDPEDADIPMAADQEITNIGLMSTKVKALVADLCKHCYNEKR
jgi:hypothetical protein